MGPFEEKNGVSSLDEMKVRIAHYRKDSSHRTPRRDNWGAAYWFHPWELYDDAFSANALHLSSVMPRKSSLRG
jgi:hypothetical protein